MTFKNIIFLYLAQKQKSQIVIVLSMIITSTILCACNISTGNIHRNNLDYSRFSVKTIDAIPPSVTINTALHESTSSYYTGTSNISVYTAIVIKSFSNTKISNISLVDNSNNTFEIVDESIPNIYKIPQCKASQFLPVNEECEIMLHIVNPSDILIHPVKLLMVINGQKYQKLLSKSGVLYIAGDFTQVYGNGITNAIPQQSGIGHCGPNGDKPCQLIEYNPDTGLVRTVATTNNQINDITIDNDNQAYIGGLFTSFISGTTIIGDPSDTGFHSLIIKMQNTESSLHIIDWIKYTFGNTAQYPDGGVYALEYNPSDNKLYMAGGFMNMANYTNSNGFPILNYNLTTNDGVLRNVFGNNVNNPDQAVTALGFNQDFMYVSGFYSKIDDNRFNDGLQQVRTINKCSLNIDSYYCLTGSDYYLSITSNQSYVEPAYSLTFAPSGALYASGGFNRMYFSNVGPEQEILGRINGAYLLAINSNPSLSFVLTPVNNWTSVLNDSTSPDNIIGVVTPYENNKFFVGGQFSHIGGLVSDNNTGECGNGTQSCMLAQFDGINWKAVFTTDGLINTITPVVGMTIK